MPAQKAASTFFDLRHSARSECLKQRTLLVMTGGTFANDRCSTFPSMDEWLQKLLLTIFDEAQQFGSDREVSTVAMLPAASLIVRMGDAQQTLGGIVKAQDQFAISRRQLMMRKRGLRCLQKDVTSHSLSKVLGILLNEVDDPSATAVLASASSDLVPYGLISPTLTRMPHLKSLIHIGQGVTSAGTSNVLACSLSIVAHICSLLDKPHEWLPHIQAKDTLSAASAAGAHAWGLMQSDTAPL